MNARDILKYLMIRARKQSVIFLKKKSALKEKKGKNRKRPASHIPDDQKEEQSLGTGGGTSDEGIIRERN